MEISLPDEGENAIGGNQVPMIHREVQQTSRKKFLPLLLAGVLMLPFGSPVVSDAAEKPKEVQKAEDPEIMALRSEVVKRIADLDHDHFLVREQAQRRLAQMSGDWVKKRKEPFPLESLLTVTKGYSPEQSRRLEKVYDVYTNEKVKLLWLPTKFEVPEAWENRETTPKVSEVLQELEVQGGRPICLRLPPWTLRERDRANILERPIQETLKGKTLLEALATVRKAAGESYALHHWFDDSIRLEDASHHELYAYARSLRTWTDAKGSLLTQLSGPYPEITPQRYRLMGVDVLTERKIILGHARVIRGKGKTTTGEEFVVRDSEAYQSVLSGPGCYVHLPLLPGAKKVSLSLEVECMGYAPVSVPIVDVKKGQDIKTPFGTLQFQGVYGTRERRTDQCMIWQVRTTTPEEYSFIVSKTNLLRCYAFNMKGQPINPYGRSSENWPTSALTWEFWEKPHRLEFLIPGRSTTTLQTFTFPDVSLEPLPRIERGEGVSGAVRRLLRPWLPRE